MPAAHSPNLTLQSGSDGDAPRNPQASVAIATREGRSWVWSRWPGRYGRPAPTGRTSTGPSTRSKRRSMCSPVARSPRAGPWCLAGNGPSFSAGADARAVIWTSRAIRVLPRGLRATRCYRHLPADGKRTAGNALAVRTRCATRAAATAAALRPPKSPGDPAQLGRHHPWSGRAAPCGRGSCRCWAGARRGPRCSWAWSPSRCRRRARPRSNSPA